MVKMAIRYREYHAHIINSDRSYNLGSTDVKRKVDKKDYFMQCLEMGMALDVVCGMQVDEKTAKWKSAYKGRTYYFCAPACKKEFDKNPEKYTKSN